MGIFDFLKKNKTKNKRFTRKAFRSKVKFLAQLTPIQVQDQSEWNQMNYAGTGIDLSPKGLSLETSAPIEVGDVIQISISLNKNARKIEVSAKSRNVRASQNGKNIVGFEFSKPSPDVVKYLENILLLYRQ